MAPPYKVQKSPTTKAKNTQAKFFKKLFKEQKQQRKMLAMVRVHVEKRKHDKALLEAMRPKHEAISAMITIVRNLFDVDSLTEFVGGKLYMPKQSATTGFGATSKDDFQSEDDIQKRDLIDERNYSYSLVWSFMTFGIVAGHARKDEALEKLIKHVNDRVDTERHPPTHTLWTGEVVRPKSVFNVPAGGHREITDADLRKTINWIISGEMNVHEKNNPGISRTIVLAEKILAEKKAQAQGLCSVKDIRDAVEEICLMTKGLDNGLSLGSLQKAANAIR